MRDAAIPTHHVALRRSRVKWSNTLFASLLAFCALQVRHAAKHHLQLHMLRRGWLFVALLGHLPPPPPAACWRRRRRAAPKLLHCPACTQVCVIVFYYNGIAASKVSKQPYCVLRVQALP